MSFETQRAIASVVFLVEAATSAFLLFDMDSSRPRQYLSTFLHYWITPAKEHFRKRHMVFVLLQFCLIGLWIVFWKFCKPLPGYAVLVISIIAALMTIHEGMRAGHKIFWMLLIGAFAVIEFRAISQDRAEFVRDEQSRRASEDASFFKSL